MKNLINFFFSFDKLMKEKLVIAFFWLAIIVFSLAYFSTALSTIKLGPLASVVDFINFFGSWLLAIVGLRLLCEVAVAIFRINNNLSPDGGKSETANIDPIVEARKAAEAAAARARDLSKTAGEKASAATKTAVEKTKHAAENVKNSAEDATEAAVSKTKSASDNAAKTVKAAAPRKRKTATAKKPATKATPKSKTKTAAAPKKRGRPAGSKNRTTTIKTPKPKTTSSTAPKKRGPKPGSKAPRDAQGRLLKKDGTLRGKPGPKKK